MLVGALVVDAEKPLAIVVVVVVAGAIVVVVDDDNENVGKVDALVRVGNDGVVVG